MRQASGARIRYMGGKHQLAPTVASVVRGQPDGPLLDLFSGMCSVAGAASRHGRVVWCNDIQKYAALVAEVLAGTPAVAQLEGEPARNFWAGYNKNRRTLTKRFAGEIAAERKAIAADAPDALLALMDSWRHAGTDLDIASEVDCLRANPEPPYRLATLTFAHGYFGLAQAIEVDSLRCAIDKIHDPSLARAALLVLLQGISRAATTSGHFAEFLRPSATPNWRRFQRQRRASLSTQFDQQVGALTPFGTPAWRSHTRVFLADALSLLPSLQLAGLQPGVIYADPPYSKAQYSRYYHVLETVVRYDYPASSSKGRYRPDRFTTPFSSRSRVVSAFSDLARGAAQSGASLVLTYPSNGLLLGAGVSVPEVLGAHYRSVRVVARIPKQLSTLGGRHGPSSTSVHEEIFVASGSRWS
jgi:adenine-specific DNA-methyltransferase